MKRQGGWNSFYSHLRLGKTKHYICFKVKILSCLVWAKAGGNPVGKAGELPRWMFTGQ